MRRLAVAARRRSVNTRRATAIIMRQRGQTCRDYRRGWADLVHVPSCACGLSTYGWTTSDRRSITVVTPTVSRAKARARSCSARDRTVPLTVTVDPFVD